MSDDREDFSTVHTQYCRNGSDITGHVYSQEDSDEMRIWDDSTLIIALTKGGKRNHWHISGSDVFQWTEFTKLRSYNPEEIIREVFKRVPHEHLYSVMGTVPARVMGGTLIDAWHFLECRLCGSRKSSRI